MKTGCFLLTLFISMSSSGFAESMTGYSAEWLSHQSSLIAVATPLSVEEIKGEGEITFIKTRFEIIEIYKGPLSNGDTVTVFEFPPAPHRESLFLEDAIKKKRNLLVFCNVAKDAYKEVNGKYIFTVHHEFSSAYYPDQPVEKLYTPDFQLLTEYSEMLERTTKQIEEERQFERQYREMKVIRKRIEAPYDSPAGQDLYAGSDCGIWIPEYQSEAMPISKTFIEDNNGNFILYISNQSFAVNPVDIQVFVDGKKVIDQTFDVKGKRVAQHNWIPFQFKASPGSYRLRVESKKGKALLKTTFEIQDKNWAVIDYWNYPKVTGGAGPTPPKFTFNIQDKPIGFE